jgi:hypothetical protein
MDQRKRGATTKRGTGMGPFIIDTAPHPMKPDGIFTSHVSLRHTNRRGGCYSQWRNALLTLTPTSFEALQLPVLRQKNMFKWRTSPPPRA